MRQILFTATVMAALLVMSCTTRKADELEMRRSINNFIFSVDELDVDGLGVSASIPGVSDSKGMRVYVKNLLINYIDSLKTGKIEFDETGVVLTRFLGLSTHRYTIEKMDIDREEGKAELRISVYYSYVNNIRSAYPEKGTTYYVPTEPWGYVNKLVIGEDNPIPRDDLDYIEFDVDLIIAHEYEGEGYWRVTKMEVDEDSLKYKTSYESFSGDE